MILDTTQTITQAAFAGLIGVSAPAVSEFVSRGIITPGEPVGAWLLSYSAHMREVAAGRATTGDLDLATERAGLAKAQREKIEMQNAVTRKELAPTYMLEAVIAAAGTRAAAILDAIPGAIRRRNQALTAADIETIASEIAKARNIAAGMTLDDLADDEPRDEPRDEPADEQPLESEPPL
jgi:phage terminase Nu1 subunit (DNA packaging protein)